VHIQNTLYTIATLLYKIYYIYTSAIKWPALHEPSEALTKNGHFLNQKDEQRICDHTHELLEAGTHRAQAAIGDVPGTQNTTIKGGSMQVWW